MVTNKVVIGTAPDSWGIWFAEDPNQTPPDRFLDEVVQAGYEWIEIGAYGYLPTDPAKLRDDLNSRRLKVSGGTTFARLQHPGTIDDVWENVAPIASLTAAMGAEHMVVIPDLWRDDLTGNEKESRELSAEQWTALVDGNNELGGGCSRSTASTHSSTPTPTATSATSATSSASSNPPILSSSISASILATSPTTAATLSS